MTGKLRLHVKNNRAGEAVFRMTPERVAAALARHPDVADRVEVFIDFNLDNFEDSIATADALITWDLPTADLRARAPKLKWIHVIGAGIEHLLPLDWLPRGSIRCFLSHVPFCARASSAARSIPTRQSPSWMRFECTRYGLRDLVSRRT